MEPLMDIKPLLNIKLITFSDLKKKAENLELLVRLIKNENLVEDIAALKQSIFSREKLMSTGIGLGIAIPHVRIKGVDNIIIAIAINKDGIKDYESLDGSPVRMVIMIIAGEEQHRDYLMLLSQIVKILKKNSEPQRVRKFKRPGSESPLICSMRMR